MTESNKILQKQFGEHLKAFRIKKNISQEEFAEKAGLDRTYISGLERGLRNPSLVILFKLSSALNISITKLLKPLEATK